MPAGAGSGEAARRGGADRGKLAMLLLDLLLPGPECDALSEGWQRQGYRPRHGRPPPLVRAARVAGAALRAAQGRYLGAREEDSVPAPARTGW